MAKHAKVIWFDSPAAPRQGDHNFKILHESERTVGYE